ncbi:MAG: PRTRC system protein B [Candidatus Angelobacter sp. Gp1-AA117]|nr:MAG: PRTRC system protein B [Candidatus Angelobacter sp. Gp1-AA117]
MQVTTEIGNRHQFVLKKALLIYEDQISRREQFVTVHDVLREGAEPHAPRLGPGTLLTTAFLKHLCRGLERKIRTVILPENVLICASDLMVWWTPGRLHRMYFSDGAEDRREIEGRVCPHPPLLWSVRHGRLSLRALLQAVRPTAATELMIAPYWNTEPSRGDVCEGDMRRPRETDISNILQWEEGFFNSRFTHPSGMGKLTTHSGGFIGLWTELVGRERFPGEYLIPARQTLQQFVGEVT